jgi:TadE-like protein
MREQGQGMVEFALIGTIVLMMTVGVSTVALAFYQYNAVSDLARYGARWGGVVGGSCAIANAVSTSDYCNQLGGAGTATNFWSQSGNTPLQGYGVACPSFDSNPSAYYTAKDPDNDSDDDFSGDTESDSGKTSTIVGAVAKHFDTSNTSPGFVGSVLGAGISMNTLKVCIATSWTNSPSTIPAPGSSISVTLYYKFQPASGFLIHGSMPFGATSQYQVE